MDFKKLLKRLKSIEQLIAFDFKEIEELEKIKYGIKGQSYDSDRVVSSVKKDWTELIIKIIDLQSKLYDEINDYLEIKSEISRSIDKLDDLEKLVIQFKFLKNKDFNEVASILGLKKSYVENITSKAIKKLNRGI